MSRIGIVVAGLVVLAVTAVPVRSQTIACRSTSDLAVGYRKSLETLISSSDTMIVRARTVMHLPSGAASDVASITTDSVCTQAAHAYFSAVADSATESVAPVWVMKVGTDRYVVFDGLHSVGGRYIQVVFDGAMNYLVSLAG